MEIYGPWDVQLPTLSSRAIALFQSLLGFSGSWDISGSPSSVVPPPCFNPFSGFLGPGTWFHPNGVGIDQPFQSLLGFSGSWDQARALSHQRPRLVSIPSRVFWVLGPMNVSPAKAEILFQSLLGFSGSWDRFPRRTIAKRRSVSIPSRVFWVLGRSVTTTARASTFSFNPFSGFLGPGTHLRGTFRVPSIGFNPFSGFLGPGTSACSSRMRSRTSCFNPFSGFLGPGTTGSTPPCPYR